LIDALVLPLVLVDLFTTLYQRVCFPVYGIGRVRRDDYVIIDRHLLGYLNLLEKLHCVYCGYAREFASRTEQYFCPIKHAVMAAGRMSAPPASSTMAMPRASAARPGALRRALCKTCGKGGRSHQRERLKWPTRQGGRRPGTPHR
jgi:hypothetical protein